jgi:hypothetical protein
MGQAQYPEAHPQILSLQICMSTLATAYVPTTPSTTPQALTYVKKHNRSETFGDEGNAHCLNG